VTITPDLLPDDIDALKAALIAERAERIAAQALAAASPQMATAPGTSRPAE
jgi:hypothetical protein